MTKKSFLFEEGRSLAQEGKYKESNDVLYDASQLSSDPMIYNLIGKNYQQMGEYGMAKKYFFIAQNILPNRLYPTYLLAKLYMETGEMEQARQMAEEVLKKETKIASPATREMKDEMRRFLEQTAKKE